MAENCDKELRLWYDLVLGGMAFGIACDLGVVIAARLESETLLKLCKVLHNLDQLFELGVMLWGIALAYGFERPGRRRRVQGARDVAKGPGDDDTRACLLGDVHDPDRRRRRRREVHGNDEF